MAEEDPIAFARVVRRRRNKVNSSAKKEQEEQREKVERSDGERMRSAASSGSGDSSSSGGSLGPVTGLMADDYYLHPFRHTRTSVNKEVCVLVFLIRVLQISEILEQLVINICYTPYMCEYL